MSAALPAEEPSVLQAFVRAFERRGATVVVGEEQDNLVRMEDVGGHRVAVVRCEGLENLVHEYVHMLRAGVLEDDHGIDYSAIPFDARSPVGRGILFDELAACVISCAYGGRPADLWFREQIEIQPVFYGHEQTPGRFWDTVASIVREHGGDLDRIVSDTYDRVESELLRIGASRETARPSRRMMFGELWRSCHAGLARG